MTKKLLALAAVAAVTGLSACGGSGDDSAPPAVTSEVPASASQTVADFIGYLQKLVVASADTLEPVDVSAVTPQTSETDPPTPVD